MIIITPGVLSTIQDYGRYSHMNSGFSPNGAMDLFSLKIANLLVGNHENDGVIEMTMMGISAKFDCDCVIALTGANMSPEINGKSINMYESVEVHKNDILSTSITKSGLRTYLAVAGGFDLPTPMGSMSTNIRCMLGGFNGRKLCAGDKIPLRHNIPFSILGKRHINFNTEYPKKIYVRVILGPQDDYFTDCGIRTFLQSEYIVSNESDRMGIRLTGDKIENKNGVDIISDGIVTGSIQISPSGTPIIMMADRQTTGGYAKIATVISVDLKLVAQAMSGTKFQFVSVTEKEAVSLLRKEERMLKQLKYEIISSI